MKKSPNSQLYNVYYSIRFLFSLLLLQFTYIEALCNIIAECTLIKSNKNEYLSSIEIDHLHERKGDYKKERLNIKAHSFELKIK